MPLDVPVLTGRWVQLEPLRPKHRDPLRQAADHEQIWTHTLTVANGPHFDAWFDDARAEQGTGRRAPFAVRRVADGRLLGSTSYLDVQLKHKRVEIGSTWYRPEVWATAVNPECKLLLLQHAFDVLGVNRVALVTDAVNHRSQSAIARLGAVREGTLRAHMVSQGGRVRDTVVFSIVAAEWPDMRDRLLQRLANAPKE